MAKSSLKKTSVEEIIIPKENHPYRIPQNWCWIHLLDAFENNTDSKKKLQTKEYLLEGKYPIVDQGQEFIGGYTDKEDFVYQKDLPVIIFGDHTRCMKYIDFRFVQGADGVKVLKPKAFWNPKAFYYAFQSIEMPSLGYRRHFPLFKNFQLPVPPIEEQERIVEKIEDIFAKIDGAIDNSIRVLQESERIKNAILYNAMSGNYTKTWRSEQIETGWKDYTIEDVCQNIVDCPHSTPEWKDDGIICLRTTNIKQGYFDFEGIQFVNESTYTNRVERLIPKAGDLIFTREGNVGDVAIVPENMKLCMGQRMMLMRTNEKCLPKYLMLYLISPFIRNYIKENIMGTTAPRMNIKDIKKLKIRIPSIEEQAEILNIIEPLLDKLDECKRLANIVEQAETLKKAVLAKAFRGELGTNCSSDTDSLVLIKSILGGD